MLNYELCYGRQVVLRKSYFVIRTS